MAVPREVRSILERHGVRLKRKWGQNFLVDENILRQIVAAAALSPDDVVIEIGPGIGALTQQLAARASRVIAIEIDRELVQILRELFAFQPHVEIVAEDALRVDLGALVPDGRPMKVVANLPYYITSPLILHILAYSHRLTTAVLMIQSEVADRLVAPPGTKAYGSLSVAVRYRAEVEVVAKVPKTVFFPPPKVDSKVVRLTPRAHEPQARDEALFTAVVRAAFGQRRKMLRSALQGLAREHGVAVEALLTRARLDGAQRAEDLDIGAFVALADALYEESKLRM